MSSLSSCMKKAGKALSKADVESLTSNTKYYTDLGDTPIVAATKAIKDLVRSNQKTVLEYEKEITDKGGDVQASGFDIENEIFLVEEAKKSLLKDIKLTRKITGTDGKIHVAEVDAEVVLRQTRKKRDVALKLLRCYNAK